MKLSFRGGRRMPVLLAGAAAVLSLPMSALVTSPADAASPAPASLPGTNWVQATIPANYSITPDPAPLSCVAASGFCVAIAQDSAVTVSDINAPEPLVTTNSGKSWAPGGLLPATMAYDTALSCPTTTVCWAGGYTSTGTPDVAMSADGGQSWTDMTPSSWPAGYTIATLDCTSATTCWLGGWNWEPGTYPLLAETTNGGGNWTVFDNLPSPVVSYDYGTYAVNAVSCTSALDCVAAGGLNGSAGPATVISTTDGGATWSLSADPTLTGLQQIMSLSCLPGSSGLPECTAAGDALEAAGPVVISSADGGITWSGMETYDDEGWMSSVSCPDAAHCWAAGAGTKLALVGTSNGGGTWSGITADTSNIDGTISCASVRFCAVTTDDGLWVTTDGGGLTGSAADHALAVATAVRPVSHKLPAVSGANVSGRVGRTVTVTGKFRGTASASKVRVTIKAPGRGSSVRTVGIGQNRFFSVALTRLKAGVTTVRFPAGNGKTQTIDVHGYPAAAPGISALSVHAGRAAGGTRVTVRGINFRQVASVRFGTARGARVRVLSPTELTVIAPAGRRVQFVTVVTKLGGPSPLTGRAAFNYLPVPAVTGLSPATGAAAGGNTVTISGTGFGYVNAVYFGSRRATHVRVVSARQIRVTVPPGSGKVKVTVVTAGGRSVAVAADVYTY